VDVRSSYDAAAEAYAERLFGELARKPLDRHLLNRFAEAVAGRGPVADLGCGPGHVARYLHECGGVSISGIDLSPGMVRCAARRCPGIEFRVGDMRALDAPDGHFAGLVAFYSIVHFAPDELAPVLRECRRALAPGGALLLAFHAGDQVVHLDELFGRPVSLDFHFHQPAAVVRALEAAGLAVTEATEREPYPDVEHQSRRCYLFATATERPAPPPRTIGPDDA